MPALCAVLLQVCLSWAPEQQGRHLLMNIDRWRRGSRHVRWVRTEGASAAREAVCLFLHSCMLPVISFQNKRRIAYMYIPSPVHGRSLTCCVEEDEDGMDVDAFRLFAS